MLAGTSLQEAHRILGNLPIPIAFYADEYKEKLRRCKVIQIYRCMSSWAEFNKKSDNERVTLVKQIENACFTCSTKQIIYAGHQAVFTNTRFVQMYDQVCARVTTNLDRVNDVGNMELIERVLGGSLDIDDLPTLSSLNMMESRHADIVAHIEKVKSVKKSVTISELYECPHCHHFGSTSEIIYNKGMDEGEDLKCTCLNCRKDFLIGGK